MSKTTAQWLLALVVIQTALSPQIQEVNQIEALRILQSDLRDSFSTKDKRDQTDRLNEAAFAAVDAFFGSIIAEADTCELMRALIQRMTDPKDANAVRAVQLHLLAMAQANMAREVQLMRREIDDLSDAMVKTKLSAKGAAAAAEKIAHAIREEYYAEKKDAKENRK